MLWGLIGKGAEGTEQPAKQGINAKTQTEAQKIDAFFDALLYKGMPMEEARWVEEQRAAAHAEVTREALAAALDGWERPPRMR